MLEVDRLAHARSLDSLGRAGNSPAGSAPPLLQRVRSALDALGCGRDRVWARTSGLNVLLGLARGEPFARVVPFGNGSFGLGFRSLRDPERALSHRHPGWEPLLLIDDLETVVEHALIAVDAISPRVD
jgi:hypothetical protein